MKLDFVLDSILPADPALGMPAGSSVNLEAHMSRVGLASIIDEFLCLLDKASHESAGRAFTDLSAQERLAAINACRTRDVRLFSAFLTEALRAYYSDPFVLRRLASGATPPFPQGNVLGSDDWSILEPVFERGPIWRDIGDD